MAVPDIGETAAATWEAIVNPEGPTDNIFNSRALFYSLAGGGQKGLKTGIGFQGKRSIAGGRVFEASLEYVINPTFKAYGQFAQLDIQQIDVFDAARFEQKTAAGTVNWNDLELAQNQEPSQKIDLLDKKLGNGKDSHIDSMNKQLLGVAPPSVDNVVSIQTIISSTPGAPGDIVGGIDANLWPFWRNKQTAGTATVSPGDNLRAAMRSISNQCSRGGLVDQPTAALSTRAVFELYESLLIPQERFTVDNKEKDGQGAFNNDVLKFKKSEIFFDEDLNAPVNLGNLYFYHPKYLYIAYLKGYWMKIREKLEPVNQLMYSQAIRTHWAFMTDQRRRLGVVTAIS